MTELSLALDTPDLAAHYESNSVDRQFKAGKRLIERIGIRPGQSVLDVGGSKDHPNRIHDIQRRVLARAPYNAHVQPEQGLPHRVSPDELRGLLDQAGFDIVSLDVEPNANVHKDAEAAIKHSLASSFGNLLGHLPEALRESARRDVIAELQQYQTAEGIKQDGSRILAVAVKRA